MRFPWVRTGFSSGLVLSSVVGLSSLGLAMAGCDGGAPASDAGVLDAASSEPDAFVVDGGPTGAPVVRFDLGALADDFYAFPFPSDLRLTAEGTPDLTGFPAPTRATIVQNLLPIASQRPGWPVIPVGYFRFSTALAPRVSTDILAAEPTSPILLVDVDPDSPDRGQLIPTIARTLPYDAYASYNVLSVAAVPGWILHPHRTYAFVVRTSANAEDGSPLATEPNTQALLTGTAPDASWGEDALALYTPLAETLSTLGIAQADVAAATVFTTADVVEDLRTRVEALRDRHDVTIEGLAVDATDGDHATYCELHGTVSMPQFQVGTPPFNTEGQFALGDDGLPIEQRRETVPVVITIPHEAMPAEGHPLMFYIHGSGGVAAQVVDRGPFVEGGDYTPGEGPAFVIAPFGFASFGAAMPLSPDRLEGASELAYLNFSNLAAFPFTFEEGVIEQALLLDALTELRIDPDVLAGCTGVPALPEGETAHRFDTSKIVGLGQSMGAMYLNMFAAVEPRLMALAPTGSGGFWSYMILETDLVANAPQLLGTLLGADGDALTHLHPAMHLLQLAWEPAEPIVFMPRVSRRPLDGIAPRPIFEPVGQGDSFFPTVLYDAVALAYGHRQVGDVVWSSMQDRLAYAGLDGLLSYPVRDDVVSETGAAYTGAIVQSAGDGFSDPHEIFMQIPGIRHQWGCFLRSAIDGDPTIVAPAAVGAPCE